jgi:rhodanese-related sulfurtransferase
MITQMSAPDLKSMIDEGRAFELFDVRTTDERAIAQIDGSRAL